jgi:hypothetical protein
MFNKLPIKTQYNHINIFLLLCLLLLTTSCIKKPNNQPAQIRLVNLNGEAKPIKRIMPKGNAQMLAMQSEYMIKDNDNQNIDDNSSKNISNTTNNNILAQNSQNLNATQPFIPNNDLNITKQKSDEVAISYDMSKNNNDNITKQKSDEIAASYDVPKNNNNIADKVAISVPQKTNIQKPKVNKQSILPKPNKKFKFITTKTKIINNYNAKSNKQNTIFIQIGFFHSPANANIVLTKSKIIANSSIKEVTINGQNGHKVFLGPIYNDQKAIKILAKAKKSGYKDAFIVK